MTNNLIDDKPDNPSAFQHESLPSRGMSLRDYFAAAALQGILSSQEGEVLGHFYGAGGNINAAEKAYGFADAMLEARAK